MVHKECEALKNSGYGTTELRKDIEEMENEKEIVAKRIERMQRKVCDGTDMKRLYFTHDVTRAVNVFLAGGGHAQHREDVGGCKEVETGEGEGEGTDAAKASAKDRYSGKQLNIQTYSLPIRTVPWRVLHTWMC